jgi:hypothetical protein
MHPAGPEPPMVYWIRRVAIIVIALTVVIAGWWLIGALLGGGDGGTEDTGSVPASSTEPVASADATAAPDASTSAQPAQDAEPVACENDSILVEATTDASTYPVGSTPRLTLTITNTGPVACKRDVGPKANELEITSGGYHVWSSDDCNASNKSKVVVLEPDEKVASSITWNGRLSQKGCPDDGKGAQAKAGRYDLTGRNLKVTSEPTPFGLSNN